MTEKELIKHLSIKRSDINKGSTKITVDFALVEQIGSDGNSIGVMNVNGELKTIYFGKANNFINHLLDKS